MRRRLKKFIIVVTVISLAVYGSPHFVTEVYAKKTVIALDAGHGGGPPNGDAGAVSPFGGDLEFAEADWTIKVVKRAQKALEASGYKVVLCSSMIRTGPKTPISDRLQKAKNSKCAVFVSVHFNAGAGEKTNRSEVYLDDNCSKKSEKLAGYLYDALEEQFKDMFVSDRPLSKSKCVLHDRDSHLGSLGVTGDKSYNFATCLIECCFISCKKVCERQRDDNDYITNKSADALVNGIAKYLGDKNIKSTSYEKDTVPEAGADIISGRQEYMADAYGKHTLSGYTVDEVKMSDLTVGERTMVRGIQNYIDARSNTISGKIRVAVVFSGLVLSIYGLLLFLCFWLDRYNVTKEFQLLKFVSFGKYEVGLDEDKCLGTKYVNLKKAIIILLESVFVAVFILSGYAFEFLDTIYKLIVDIFS